MIKFRVYQPDRILSAASGPDLLYWVSQSLEGGIKYLLIDFRNVLFMDSSGLGALVIAFNRVKKAEGKLALCSLTGQARMLFDTAGMENVFEIYFSLADYEEAIAREMGSPLNVTNLL